MWHLKQKIYRLRNRLKKEGSRDASISSGKSAQQSNSETCYLHFFSYQMIEPAGVGLVRLETLCLQQLNQVLNRRPEVTTDGQLL